LKEENVPKLRWLRLLSLLAASSLFLAACSLEGPQSTFNPVGPIAKKQIWLFAYTGWLSLIVLLGVGATLIWVMMRFRKQPGDETLPPQIHGNTLLEIGLILLATFITVLVAIPTVRTYLQTGQHVEPGPDDVRVKVTGYQWWWAFEYPDLGIVTANELHIPQGKRVVFDATSADVLHAFWVPKLAGKVDLIPNQNNQLWFITDEDTPTGVYHGQCAELCLGAHAYMRFRVIVDSPQDYETWVAGFQNIAPLPVQADPLVEQGKVLFSQKGCGACHAIRGYTTGQPDKPNLTNFGLRHTVAAGILDNTPENLARWLRDPQEVKPTNRMPTLWNADDPKRDEQIAAIAAYLLSLGKTATPQASLGGTYGH
jgi:cytochrome c oxidase subunit II